MSNNLRAQNASTPIMAATATATATTTTQHGHGLPGPVPHHNPSHQVSIPIRIGGGGILQSQFQQQQQQQQMPIVSPVVSPVPQRQDIAMIPSQAQASHPPQYQYTTNGRINISTPPPQYSAVPVIAPNANANGNHNQHPAAQHAHNINLGWQQQQHHLQPLQQQHQQQQQQKFIPQQQGQLQLPLQLQTTSRPSRVENDNSDDVSSIPWGSIRPDPGYDPAKDPLHPANINKPFVPPAEISITIVRGRRRKTMNNHASSSSGSQPQSSVVGEEERYQLQTTPVSTADWLQVPPLEATYTGSTDILPPALGPNTSMDFSNKNPVSNDNSYDDVVDDSESDSDEIEEFSDIATYTAVDVGAEEYLDLRGDLLELQKLQELQHPPYYDGIEVQANAGDQGSDELNNNNNNHTNNHNLNLNNSMEVTIENTQPQPQPQQRKGMVRREFSRRVLRFKKKKANNSSNMIHNSNNNNNDDDGDNNEAVADAVDTDVGVSVDVDELVVKPTKKKMGYYSPFVTHYYNKSKMMTLVSDQENGC